MSWGAIGARINGNPVFIANRRLASCPVGFKMVPMASIKVAIDAINVPRAALLSPSLNGAYSAIVNTSGNGDRHIILRGGKAPNYSAQHVAEVKEGLTKADRRRRS